MTITANCESTGHLPRKVNHNIDILKYVMCIMILMIHTGYSFQLPVLRAAVPVFFIISSYLFFNKIKSLDSAGQLVSYKKFLRRASLLYLFWFVVLLPVTVMTRHWMDLEPLMLLKKILIGVFLQSTFPASWYISAYILGISIAFLLRRHNRILIAAGLVCYAYCCLTSNYDFLPLSREIEFGGIDWFTSFPSGLLYVGCGKIIAECRVRSLALGIAGIIAGGLALFFESRFLTGIPSRVNDDCYFSLIILAPAIFMLVISLPDKVTMNTATIRNMSTIYYCSHLSLRIIIAKLAPGLDRFQLLMILIVLCTVLSVILLRLARVKYLRWLKYSY